MESAMQTTAQAQGNAMPTKTDRQGLLSPLVMALGALLVVQLLAALALDLGGKDMSPTGPSGPLLAFDPEQVTGIQIQAAEGEPVRVAKGEEGWTIPSLADLPAAEQKVTGLLTKLEGLQKGLPVATSEEALKRFKVADEAFERKLTLEGGDAPLAVLYLGDSPGFRRLFVRGAGDGAVYDAELGLFDAPDKADDWSDRTLLHLDAEQLKQLTFAGATLAREEDAWQLTDLADGQEQDAQAVEDAVRTLSSIDFLGVLSGEEEPSVDQEAAPTQITATLASNETVRYQITKLAEGNDYLLEVSNRPQRFRIAAYVAEDLTGLSRDELLVQPEEDEDTVESAPTEPQPTEATESAGAQAVEQAPTVPPAQTQEAGTITPEEPAAAEDQATATAPETPQTPGAPVDPSSEQ